MESARSFSRYRLRVHREHRAEACETQCTNPRVYHSADSNKSEIVVVFDTEDTKKAKDFAASADLKEAMEKAGVLDTPTIYFLESID
jgi:hypothetical protein